MISEFRGDFYFLSNFFQCPVTFDNITYLNNEAAFQAQKVLDQTQRAYFRNLTPDAAKARGRKVILRPDWEEVKDDLMYRICKQKFTQCETLGDALIATGDEDLVEGNHWHDNYWGVCSCAKCSFKIGNNALGKILMRVRSELQPERN